jgi:poly-gamma-glutamate synthesis protein (capsule biosynthesis protein)
MKRTLMMTGDVNLMNVDDPAVPFARIRSTLRSADVVFGNLECCFYEPPGEHSVENEGFYAPLSSVAALRSAGYHALGNANNVNYGADAIESSLACLDQAGIPHAGTGLNRKQARAPVVVDGKGLKFGLLQRTSVYWPNNHEATEHSTGVAVLKGHTAYQPMFHKLRPDIPPANRPGVPPAIVTWADTKSLALYTDDIVALKKQADIAVASNHWGLWEEVLEYQVEIAHAAIDAGADVVMGHGPHYSCAVEMYRGKPIFYGLGSFSFHTGHGGLKHGDWVGMLARVGFEETELVSVAFSLVRHNDRNETYVCDLGENHAAVERITSHCDKFGTQLKARGEELVVWEKS